MSIGNLSVDSLKQIVARIERLEEEKVNILTDIREVYGEAKSIGFDPKILRQIIRIRKMEQDKVQEQEALLEMYKEALGMTIGETVS